MYRRNFLRALTVATAGLGLGVNRYPTRRTIQTVTGPVAAADLGLTLMHEHLIVDFIGAEAIKPGRYDPQEVFRTARPHLQRLRELGCRTFVDCTPAYLGRDARLLRQLARASGLRIITNTGYYGAGNG